MLQRFYLYVVAFAGFAASITALNRLLGALGEAWFGSQGGVYVLGGAYQSEVLAASAGVLVVAVPIYLLHWNLIERRLAQPGEATAALRKLFLYGASAVAVGFALYSAYVLLGGLAALAMGESLSESEIWPNGWFQRATMLAIGLLLERYFQDRLIDDGDYGCETGVAAVPRKLFHGAAGLVALALIVSGGSSILETLWLLAIQNGVVAAAGVWWRQPLADGAAILLVGLGLAAVNWRRWQAVVVLNAQEARSAFRLVYLYGGVVIGAVATLAPAAGLIREGLLLLLGSGASDWLELAEKLATPVGYMPVGIGIWLWHRWVLRNESERYGESTEGVVVRRIYYYVVAAVGLALVWFGAAETVSACLDWALGGGNRTDVPPLWVAPLATGLSLLAVGLPVWSMHWRTVQLIARGNDAAGAAERASLPRRIYLYVAALAGALLILYYFARVVYRLLLLLMGFPEADLLSVETADELARAAISAILWTVHVLAIRTDMRMGADAPVAEQVNSQTRRRLEQRIEQLELELAYVREDLRRLEEEPPDPVV